MGKMIKRAVAAGGAAALAAGLAAGLGLGAALAAPAPLRVTLGTQVAGDGSSAVFSATGDPVLTLGTPSGATGAYVDIASAKGQPVPASSPSFATSAYAAGSPRFVIMLSNKQSLWGYPAAAGLNGAGMAWAVDNGNTYTSYATAVAAAEKGGSGITVTDAQVVADGDQKPGTADVISGLSYGGQVLGGGTVMLRAPAAQASVLGHAVTPVKLAGLATSDVSDPAIAYAVSNLPEGLSLDAATGTLSGTPGATGTRVVTVTATDAYGDHASATFTWRVTVKPLATEPYVYGGHVDQVNATRATVSWRESTATGPWLESSNPPVPPGGKCEEVWISGYRFGAWNPANPTSSGTAHVGFTCEHDNSNIGVGYLRGLAPHHTYALRIVPATGVYGTGRNHPIPGASVGYVDVFTTG